MFCPICFSLVFQVMCLGVNFFFLKNFHQFQNSSADVYVSPITEHSYPFSRFHAFFFTLTFVVIYSTHRKIHKTENYSSIIYHKYNTNLSPTYPPPCSRNRALRSQKLPSGPFPPKWISTLIFMVMTCWVFLAVLPPKDALLNTKL